MAKISEVGRSKTQDTPPDHGTNTEHDPLLEGQPVEYIKHVGRYVSSSRNAAYEARGSADNALDADGLISVFSTNAPVVHWSQQMAHMAFHVALDTVELLGTLSLMTSLGVALSKPVSRRQESQSVLSDPMGNALTVYPYPMEGRKVLGLGRYC